MYWPTMDSAPQQPTSIHGPTLLPMAHDRTTSPASRLLGRLAVPAILALLALPAAALASAAGRHGASAGSHRPCAAASKPAARHSRHAAKHACVKHAAHKHAAHALKQAIRKPSSPAVELVPATCEDGTPPSHAAGGPYSCEDGSTASCEEGKLVSAPATGAPMCAVEPSTDGRCAREGADECTSGELSCEDPSSSQASPGCEHSDEPEATEEEE
jgi:hypothetical protein